MRMNNKYTQWLFSAFFILAAPLASAATHVFDVMILYNTDTSSRFSRSQIQTKAVADIEFANRALQNSRIDAQLRLVHVGASPISINGPMGGMLNRISRDQGIRQLRQQYGADFVTFYANPGNRYGNCGVGWIASGRGGRLYRNASDYGFNVVNYLCGNMVTAHELGHNMGLGHSNFQGSRGGLYPWARGYGERGNFSTIMGYAGMIRARRVPYFSNPDINSCNGRACGRRNDSDAARGVNLIAAELANFMPTQVSGGSTTSTTTPGTTTPRTTTPRTTTPRTTTPRTTTPRTTTPRTTTPRTTTPRTTTPRTTTPRTTTRTTTRTTSTTGQGRCDRNIRGQFCAKYYPNLNFSGRPAVTRRESTINHRWGRGTPGRGIGDVFTSRWEGIFNFRDGLYEFSGIADGGMRVFIDGRLVIDAWRWIGRHRQIKSRIRLSGNRRVRVEHIERGNVATAVMNWRQIRSYREATGNRGLQPTVVRRGTKPVVYKRTRSVSRSTRDSNNRYGAKGVIYYNGFNRGLGRSMRAANLIQEEGQSMQPVSAQEYNFSGLSQEITGEMTPGEAYTFSARVKLDQNIRQYVKAALAIDDDSGVHYQLLDTASATGLDFTELKSTFTPDIKGRAASVKLMIYGPDPSVTLQAQDLSILPAPAQSLLKQPGGQMYYSFDEGVETWKPGFNATVTQDVSDPIHSGSLKIFHRRHSYDGAQVDLTGQVQPNESYQLQSNIRLSGKTDQPIKLYLSITGEHGHRWEILDTIPVSAGDWQEIDHVIYMPDFEESETVSLYVAGPEPSVEIDLDEISITRQE